MRGGYRHLLRPLLGLYVPTVLMGMGQGMVVPTIPVVAAEFGVPGGLAAQIVTAQLVGRLFALLPAGTFVDRRGGRAAMLLGASATAVAALATAAAPTFWWFLLAQAVVGAGWTAWAVGREVAAVELVRREQRGRLLSTFFGLSSAAVAFGPVVGGLLADSLGLRAVFVAYAALGLVVLVIAAWLREPPQARVPRKESVFSLPRLDELAPEYRATFATLLFGTFAAQLRQSVLSALLPLHAGRELGLSSTEIGTLFGIIGVVNLLMIGPAGYVSDTFGRKAAVIPTAGLAALAFALYPFVGGFLGLAALSVVIGIATGFGLGSMTTYTYDISPRHGRGRFQGLRRIAGDAGGVLGPASGGWLATVATPGAVFLAFAPIHLLSALLLTFVARESLPRGRRRGAGDSPPGPS